MTFNDALPVLSTNNDGHCHHSCMGVFPDPQSNDIEGLAGETMEWVPCEMECCATSQHQLPGLGSLSDGRGGVGGGGGGGQ